jgi:hypothetical protein
MKLRKRGAGDNLEELVVGWLDVVGVRKQLREDFEPQCPHNNRQAMTMPGKLP